MDLLWAEMSVLKHLRDDVVKRGERNMDKWLRNVEAQEREVANLRKEIHELRKGSRPNTSGFRLELHKKVIEILGAVADLKKEGNCNVVAHRVGAAAFLEGNNMMDTGHGNSTETVEKFLSQMAREKPIRFSSTQLKSFTSNYSRHLGSGGYGEVYKGRFPNGVQLAVKILKDNVNDVVKKQFMAEVSTMGRTYHRNLVRLYGYCFDANLKALVYEFVENGSLDTFIYEGQCKIEWEKLYDIATDTAKGLSYLHENCHKRIIHFDIKAGNVLIDANLCAKVADFGLAKLYSRDSSHVTLTRFRGTPGYAAPEMWMPLPVSYKCDVYSFGMMAFEILGRKKNWNRQMREEQKWFPSQVWDKFERGQLEEVIRDCGIEAKDREKAKILCIVGLWCSQYIPQDRPSMSTVVKILEGEIQALDPPNPFPHLATSGVVSTGTIRSIATFSSAVSSELDTTEDCDSRAPIPVPVELSFSAVSPEVSSASVGRQVELQAPIHKLTTEVQKNNTVTKMVKPEEKKDEVITVVLMVYMHCEACAQEVKKYLMKLEGVQSATADLDRSQLTVKGTIDSVALVEYIYKKTNKRAMIVKTETDKTEEEKPIAEAEQRKKQEAKGVVEIKKEKKTSRHGMTVKTALPREEEGKVIEKVELKMRQEEDVAALKVERKPGKRVTIMKPESEKKQIEEIMQKTVPEKNEEQGVIKAKLEMKREDKEGAGFDRPKLAKKREEKKDKIMCSKTPKHATRTKVRKEEDNGAAKIPLEVKKEENSPDRTKSPFDEEDKDTAKSKREGKDDIIVKTEEGKDREKIIEVVEYSRVEPEMKENQHEQKGDESALCPRSLNNEGDLKEQEAKAKSAKLKPIAEVIKQEADVLYLYEDLPRYTYSYGTKTGIERRNNEYQNQYPSSYAYAPQIFSDENPNAWCSIQ